MRIFLLCGVAWLAFGLPAVADDHRPLKSVDRVQVESAFIYNFTKFVEWPDGYLQQSDALIIGVLSDAAMARSLRKAVQGRLSQGKPLVVRALDGVGGAERCHILVLGKNDESLFEEVLAAVQHLPILTVGESTAELPPGGMIQFVMIDNRIRFYIDNAAVGGSDLKFSSKLLSLAQKRTAAMARLP